MLIRLAAAAAALAFASAAFAQSEPPRERPRNFVAEDVFNLEYADNPQIARMLWYEATSVQNSINSNTVLFRLKIVPEISGFLSEFIFMDDNVLLPEAVYEGSNVSGKILLQIGFPGRTSTD